MIVLCEYMYIYTYMYMYSALTFLLEMTESIQKYLYFHFNSRKIITKTLTEK